LARGSVFEKLCSNLAEGFHAAAQPLTILRGTLDSTGADRRTLRDFRELIAHSSTEVRRLCTLYKCMNELVLVESVEAQLVATPILPLLASAASGVNFLLKKDAVRLTSMTNETSLAVLIDRERTLKALTSSLRIASTVSRMQEPVELFASPISSSTVQVVLQTVDSSTCSLDAETRLEIALAEANICSQEALFSLTLQPFRVQIELQRAQFST